MNANNENFRLLIEQAVAFSRDGCDFAQTTPGFAEAMQMIADKFARLELRISFDPVPCVTGEIIRQDDGEVLGHLFQHQARTATVN